MLLGQRIQQSKTAEERHFENENRHLPFLNFEKSRMKNTEIGNKTANININKKAVLSQR